MKLINLPQIQKKISYNNNETKTVYCFFSVQEILNEENIKDNFFFFENDARNFILKNTPSIAAYFSLVQHILYVDNEEFENYDEIEIDTDDLDSIDTDDSEEIFSTDINKGKCIKGSLIIEWTFEKYVDYSRNLINIFFAEDENLLFESDLYTGNQERINKPNYSILLTEEQIKNSLDLKEDILLNLNLDFWKWNFFKNNPLSKKIDNQIDNLLNQTLK